MAPAQLTSARSSGLPLEAIVAQRINRRFDGCYPGRYGDVAHCEPCGELVSQARPECGLMLGIPQGGSSNDPVAIAMKENQAWIWGTVVGEDCSCLVKLVHEVCRDLALLDQIRAGDRPFRVIPNGVNCGQLLERFFLLMWELPRAFRKESASDWLGEAGTDRLGIGRPRRNPPWQCGSPDQWRRRRQPRLCCRTIGCR